MSGVTVIVPLWNGRALVEPLMAALRAQTLKPAEIIVVDNGSTDGAPEAADAAGARVVRLERNFGFAVAANRGIKECATPWLALVNSDVETAPDWLEQLVNWIEEHGGWFATGKVLQYSGRDRIDGTWDAICRGAVPVRIGHGNPAANAFDQPRRISMAPATAVLYRRELFHRVGAFDERFESYLEDVDLGLRCALAGAGGWYVPAALAWHRGSASLGRWHPESVRRMSRNQVFLTARYYSKRMLLVWAWPLVFAQLLWGLVAFRHGAGRAWLRGKLEGLRRSWAFRTAVKPAGDIIRASEREIAQAEHGLFWRLYFGLTGGRLTGER